jgi:hypothetical protein
MAIHLRGTFNTPNGSSDNSYIRIEYIKVKPPYGTIEFNTFAFLSEEKATDGRKDYYQDKHPNLDLVRLVSMSLDFSGSTYPVSIPQVISVPLTGSVEEVTTNFYTSSITSQSHEVVDFDSDGNEITTTEWTYTTSSVVYSSSVAYKNPINMAPAEDPYTYCYTHLKKVLGKTLPSSSIKDI